MSHGNVYSMTTDIVPFSFEGMDLRVVMIEGNPWWVASDVTRVLGLAEASSSRVVLDRVDEEDRNTMILNHGNNGRGNPNRTIINESGLYSLILSSRKPETKRFKRWVTSEVLPEIRKWGFYNPSLSEDEKRVEVARQYYEATVKWVEAKRQLEKAAPLAARHELLQAVDGGYNVSSVGRALGFAGRLRYFWEHLINVQAVEEDSKGRLVASDQWIDLGYMVVRGMRTPVITEDGLQHLESLDLR